MSSRFLQSGSLRTAWWIAAALAAVILLASIPGYLFAVTEGHFSGQVVQLPARLVAILDAVGVLASFAAALVCLALAGLIFRRKPDDPMALYVSFYLLAFGVVQVGPMERLDQILPGIAALTITRLQPILLTAPSLLLLALFPTGTYVPRWARWLSPASMPLMGIILFVPITFVAGPSSPVIWITGSYWVLLGLLAVYAQYHRYRHVSGPAERQQTKWVVSGFTLWLVLVILLSIPYVILLNLPGDATLPWWVPLSTTAWWLSLLVVPCSLTVAVMRYRLWDIDPIVNRALVNGALTALVIATYLLAVGGLGVLLQARGNLVLSLLGAGLVAALAEPLRRRLQRAVNRLMYGERDDPYGVLSHLGERLQSAIAPEAVLPTIVETAAQELKLPYVAVALKENGSFEVRASTGSPVEDLFVAPLTYQAEAIGQLICGWRAPDAPFNMDERRLLEDVARHAGIAVHAASLTADLQRSRKRLVMAREEERRRLRRDLHDGLGPQLASLRLTVNAVEKTLDNDPAVANDLLQHLKAQLHDAVVDIRRLVYALRPPALDELGLVEALRESIAYYEQGDLRIDIDSPQVMPPLPAAVEVAIYRIAQEAVTNVVRHANARSCCVRLSLDNVDGLQLLCLTILDDGQGIPTGVRPGVGLQSMRERTAELGGQLEFSSGQGRGTRVTARLPLLQGAS